VKLYPPGWHEGLGQFFYGGLCQVESLVRSGCRSLECIHKRKSELPLKRLSAPVDYYYHGIMAITDVNVE